MKTPQMPLARFVAVFSLLVSVLLVAQPPQTEAIIVDAQAVTTAFPHFWEQTFGSGRAILSLRDSYRDDLRTVKQATGFNPSASTESLWTRWDSTIRTGAFKIPASHRRRRSTPRSITSPTSTRSTTGCSPNTCARLSNSASCRGRWPLTQPRCMLSGTSRMSHRPGLRTVGCDGPHLRRAPGRTLRHRRGRDMEVRGVERAQHRLLGGNPKQATYFELYDHTARALKAVSARLQVGGPQPRRRRGLRHFSTTPRRRTCRWTSYPPTSTPTTRRQCAAYQ